MCQQPPQCLTASLSAESESLEPPMYLYRRPYGLYSMVLGGIWQGSWGVLVYPLVGCLKPGETAKRRPSKDLCSSSCLDPQKYVKEWPKTSNNGLTVHNFTYLDSQIAGNNRPLYPKVDHYWFKNFGVQAQLFQHVSF